MRIQSRLGRFIVIATFALLGLMAASPAGAQTPAATGTPTPQRSPMDGPATTATRAPMMGAPMAPATATPDARFNQDVVQSLRRGGYIIYLRHGATDRSQQDTDPNNLANCATQRNLSEQGRTQGRAIGEAFRSLAIPIGQALSSPYCRALEFTRLAEVGSPRTETSLALPDPLPAAEQQRNTTALRQLLDAPPPAGANTLMVSHSPNLRDALGIDLVVEGSAAIIDPNGSGQPTVVAVVLPNQWTGQAGPNPVPNQMPRTGRGGEDLALWSLSALLLVGLGALGVGRLVVRAGSTRR